MAKLHDAGFTVSLFGRAPTRHEPRAPEIRCSKPRSLAMMHVRLSQNGREVRHRIMVDEVSTKSGSWSYEAVLNGRTACDVTIAGKYYAVIDPGVDGELCTDGCFTKAELRLAIELRARAEARRHDQAVKEEAERAAERERLLEDLAEKRRARTGEQPPLSKPEPEEK